MYSNSKGKEEKISMEDKVIIYRNKQNPMKIKQEIKLTETDIVIPKRKMIRVGLRTLTSKGSERLGHPQKPPSLETAQEVLVRTSELLR